MDNIVIVLLGATMLYVFATTRIEGYMRTLGIQGALLFLLVLLSAKELSLPELFFLSAETLGVKTLLIPILLLNLARRNEIRRDVESYFGQFYSLIIVLAVFILGFLISIWVSRNAPEIKPLYFGISFSIIISGLLLVVTRKKIISHILGYMMMENGIFLLSLSIAKKMPFVVNLGVILDVFVGLFLFIYFFNKIQEVFDKDHIDSLKNLKD